LRIDQEPQARSLDLTVPELRADAGDLADAD
jgi:hypothetical protein